MLKQKGFTLIELVVVIVILGLLAATALPRFINITGDARAASVNGVAGGIRSAAALARAQYLVAGSSGATTVDMGGTPVAAIAGTGYPDSTAGGMGTALQGIPSDWTVTHNGAGTTSTYAPPGYAAATCGVTYTANTGTAAVATTCN